jgi:hypothetical protein
MVTIVKPRHFQGLSKPIQYGQSDALKLVDNKQPNRRWTRLIQKIYEIDSLVALTAS